HPCFGLVGGKRVGRVGIGAARPWPFARHHEHDQPPEGAASDLRSSHGPTIRDLDRDEVGRSSVAWRAWIRPRSSSSTPRSPRCRSYPRSSSTPRPSLFLSPDPPPPPP